MTTHEYHGMLGGTYVEGVVAVSNTERGFEVATSFIKRKTELDTKLDAKELEPVTLIFKALPEAPAQN